MAEVASPANGSSSNSFVVSVVGGKGGVGKSVFATNFALATMVDQKKKVLIIDWDSQSVGDQAYITGLKPLKSMADAIKFEGKLDAVQINNFLTPHKSGFTILPGVMMAEDWGKFPLEELERVMILLKSIFPIIVVDMGSHFDAHSIKMLEFTTLILMVTNPEILVLNQTKKSIDAIQNMMFPQDMVKVVINKFSNKSGITAEMVQKMLSRQLLGAIPDDPATCAVTLTKATPFLLAAPSSEISKYFVNLVRVIQEKKIYQACDLLKKPKGSQIVNKPGEGTPEKKEGGVEIAPDEEAADPKTALKLRVHARLLEEMNLKDQNTSNKKSKAEREKLREQTRIGVVKILETEKHGYTNRQELNDLVKEILDEAVGLGALESLMANKKCSEIMVMRADLIYIELAGKIQKSPITFSSNKQLLQICERIMTPIGRRIDEKTPYQDGRLSDGSRVHIIIPPLALDGPMVTIRKFPDKRLDHHDLIRFGAMTAEMADFLRCVVEGKTNLVVSGGTGSGKTTLLNMLSNFIPDDERVLTCEDAAELNLGQEHVGRMETRPPSIEGTGAVTIRDLVKQCLRMRPDRVIVGECRAGETLDMLQAMNTGHDGSMTTVHSNNPREAVARIETLVMMAGMDLPVEAIRKQISSAVQMIVQCVRLTDGARKVTFVTEVTGMQGDTVTMQDIFIFKAEGIDKNRKIIGRHMATGFVPKFVPRLEAMGIRIPRGVFKSV